MTPAELALARIEAIVSELERLDAETGGIYRDPFDRRASDHVARILRKMARIPLKKPAKSAAE